MQILLIDDDPSAGALVRHVLTKEGHKVTHAQTLAGGKVCIAARRFDLIITDLRLPDGDGSDVIQCVSGQASRPPVIVVTAYGTTDTAIGSIQKGAFDYLTKPFEIGEILGLVQKVEAMIAEKSAFKNVWLGLPGASPASVSKVIQEVYKMIGRIAETDVSVLITGETGTGKDIAAQAVQKFSLRKNAPFVVVDCATIPEEKLEVELFGSERGVVNAQNKKKSFFEQADGGTLLLDEMGGISLSIQVKLNRFLRERTIVPLGSNVTRRFNVRVIAVTNKVLEHEVSVGRFREDLYSRLKVAHIHMPALRERAEDIEPLWKAFVRDMALEYRCETLRLKQDAVDYLRGFAWPGNIRQLETLIRKLTLSHPVRHVAKEDIIAVLVPASKVGRSSTLSLGSSADELLAAYMQKRLEEAFEENHTDLLRTVMTAVEEELYAGVIAGMDGHQSRASEMLGVSMKTLRDRLKKFRVHPKG